MKVVRHVIQNKVVRHVPSPKIARGDGVPFSEITSGFQFVSGDDIKFVSGDDFQLVEE